MNTNEEQLRKFIAQMNVFSQHQKAMDEFAWPKKKAKRKKENNDYENDSRL